MNPLTTAIFFLVVSLGMANGQEDVVQLWDGSGSPIILPNQSPAVLTTLKAGEFIHGQISPAEQITSTLQNFMSSRSTDGDTISFQGVVPDYQSSLTVGNQQIVIIPAKEDSDLPIIGTWQNLALAIGGVVLVVVVLTKLAKRGGRSNWR